MAVRKALSPYFEPGVIERYLQIMLQTAAIAVAFKINGQAVYGPSITLDTVGEAVNYFQSRRRHLVALLYTMPFACKGTEVLEPLDTLNVLLPLIEHSCVTITSLHLNLALLETLDDFSLVVDGVGLSASHWLSSVGTSSFHRSWRHSTQRRYSQRPNCETPRSCSVPRMPPSASMTPISQS